MRRSGVRTLCDTDVLRVLRRPEQLKELDGLGPPAGDVVGELLEHGQRPLAPSVRERVGDVAAHAAGLRADRVEPPHAEQFADVGDDPGVAGLDEPVLVELLDVALDELALALEDVQQRLERVAVLDVAGAVDRRQQLVEVGRRGHDAVTVT